MTDKISQAEVQKYLCWKSLISCKLYVGGYKLNSSVTYKYFVIPYLLYQNITRLITVIIYLALLFRLDLLCVIMYRPPLSPFGKLANPQS